MSPFSFVGSIRPSLLANVSRRAFVEVLARRGPRPPGPAPGPIGVVSPEVAAVLEREGVCVAVPRA